MTRGGTTIYVYALAVSGRDLYAGGQFTRAGGKIAGHAAKARIGSTGVVGYEYHVQRTDSLTPPRHGRQEHSELLREHFGSTRALIECGADVNASNACWFRSVLSWAANNARLKTIRFLLVRGARPDSLDA